jgi:peptidoglycan/LPS O-acetylase OafA/YrhL
LLVLVSHAPFAISLAPRSVAGTPLSVPDPIVAILGFGRFGVHLFLVLSGFCIHLSCTRTDQTFLRFWRRRLRRLYPPYAAALVLTVLGLFLLFGLLGRNQFPMCFGYSSTRLFALDLVLLIFLAQNANGAAQRIGNGPFWSLALEEQLYLLYFPLRWLLKRTRWRWILLIGLVVTMCWRAAPLIWTKAPASWSVLGPARWMDWILGALAVEAHLGRVQLPQWCRSVPAAVALLIVAVGINLPGLTFIAPATRLFGDLAFALFFFVVVNISVSRAPEDAAARWLTSAFASVGIFSYSLYLTHEPVLVAIKEASMWIGLPAQVITVLRVTLPIPLAYVFFRVVEKRFLTPKAEPRLSRAVEVAAVQT